MSKNLKILAASIGFLILAAGIGIGSYLVQNPQNATSEAAGVVLNMDSTSNKVAVNDTFVVTVSVDTKGLPITAADLRVDYNASQLTAISIKQAGSLLTNTLIPGKIILNGTSSEASIVLTCNFTTKPCGQTGAGALAEITFKANSNGPTKIRFGDKTGITASGKTVSVVKQEHDMNLVVGQ